MDLQRYDYHKSKNGMRYRFVSVGPKGRIRKLIHYSPFQYAGLTYYNVGFGDWSSGRNLLDDRITSNNSDHEKVLFTVACTILDFLESGDARRIFIIGTTASRTRLYQILISRSLDLLANVVKVFGYHKGRWKIFRKGINYEAFIVKLKRNRT